LSADRRDAASEQPPTAGENDDADSGDPVKRWPGNTVASSLLTIRSDST
jgi:hypothetical protein